MCEGEQACTAIICHAVQEPVLACVTVNEDHNITSCELQMAFIFRLVVSCGFVEAVGGGSGGRGTAGDGGYVSTHISTQFGVC